MVMSFSILLHQVLQGRAKKDLLVEHSTTQVSKMLRNRPYAMSLIDC